MKWSGLEDSELSYDDWESAARKKINRKRKLKIKAYLWLGFGNLFAIVCLLLYFLGPSWIILIHPFAPLIMFILAIWAGVMYLGQARRIKYW